jgi:hypothetical protein
MAQDIRSFLDRGGVRIGGAGWHSADPKQTLGRLSSKELQSYDAGSGRDG